MSEQTTSGWSLRAKVRVALFGVLLLMLPQVGLTIYYLGEMRQTAALVADRAAFLLELDKVRHEAALLTLPSPESVSDKDAEDYAETIEALSSKVRGIPEKLPAFSEEAASIARGLDDVAGKAARWFAAVARARESAPDVATFRRLVQFPEESGSDVAAMALEHSHGMADLRERFFAAVTRALDELRIEEAYASRLVGHADRNLITLTMLVFIFLAVLFVFLPENLVRPLRAMARGIREAGQGRLDVRLHAPEDDELGAIAANFNETLATLQDFDARKRDRIVADGGRLEGVLRTIPHPAAIISPSLVPEATNPAFRKLFDLQPDDEERPLPSVLDTGRRDFRQALERVVHRREATLAVPVSLSRRGEQSTHRMSAYPCRDRRGRLVGVVVVFEADAS